MSQIRPLSAVIIFAASFCGFGAILAAFSILRPIDLNTAKAELPGVYAKMNHGDETKNVDEALGNSTADYVEIEQDGRRVHDIKEHDKLARLFRDGNNIKSITELESIEVTNGVAIVKAKSHFEIDVTNTRLNRIPTVPVHSVSDNLTIDTWIKHLGQWQCSSSRILEDVSTIDGRRQRI